ncbi:E3 ubiquitin-protein ligase XIAP-like isoform X2 [Liolophura sinensis]
MKTVKQQVIGCLKGVEKMMDFKLQNRKFCSLGRNPLVHEDAQQDKVERVKNREDTIIVVVLKFVNGHIIHVHRMKVHVSPYSQLCHILRHWMDVFRQTAEERTNEQPKENSVIPPTFELYVQSDEIPEHCERHDSSGARGVMKKGRTLYYLHKDVYHGDRLESRTYTHQCGEAILPTFNSSERMISKFLKLSLGVSIFLFIESLWLCLNPAGCFTQEGVQVLALKGSTERACQKEVDSCFPSIVVCAVWILLMIILTALLPVCHSFSETRRNVSKALYNPEQMMSDSTTDWLEKRLLRLSGSEVSKSPRKWYLDWFPEGVKRFGTNAVAYPASHTGSLEQYFSQKFNNTALSEKEEMKYEWLRLQSFQNWPTRAIPFPSVLAKAGFLYSKTADKVVCFSCGGVVEGWQRDMTPMDVHREKFPHCKFVAGREENYPILPMESSEVSPVVSDVLGQTSTSRPSQNPESSPQPVSESARNDSGLPSTRSSITEGCTANSVLNVAQASSDLRDSGFTEGARSSEVTEGVSDSFINRMKHEHNRYLTYRSWPGTEINQPKLLAKAGFYYTGLNFKVLCAFCNGMLDYSEPEQEPMAYHRDLFPNCPFVRSPNAVNIPAYPVPPAGPTPPLAVQADLAMLGIMSDLPKHPEFTLLQARIDSFRSWNPEHEQRPYDLAVAGFIYAGMSDCVKCFQCDGGLRNWLPGDIPWVEHARWFPQCSHVRLCKGQEFIDTIEEMYPRQGAASSTTVTRSSTAANAPTPNVDRLMFSPAAQSVLEMGYARDLVKRGLEMFIRQKGSDSGLNAHELVEIVLEIPSVEDDLSSTSEDQQPSAAPPQPLVGATGHKSLPNFPRSNSSIVDESEIGEELDTKSLREKNRELIEQTLCKICLENKMCITFLPCGHLVSCAECAPALRKCPICRSTIKGRVRVYMS